MAKFVFVSSMAGAPWGGSEELWSQSALRLREAGHAVGASVAYWPQLSRRVTGLGKQGVDVYVRRPPSSRLAARIWRRVNRSKLPDPYSWLLRQEPGLVVVCQGGISDGWEWLRFCRENALPFVTIVQCNAEVLWPNDDFGEELAAGFRAARRVFCVSKHNLELLECQVGEGLPNAEVVWNPYCVASGPPPPWPSDDGVTRLACVARLEPAAKGQDLLFRVLALPQWRDRPVEVNFYGSGPCERSLRKMAKNLSLRQVHFRGHVDDVQSIWRENHMLVLPSRFEGLPLSLVECMWSARPAVVTDIGGNAELCVDGQTGFVAAAPAFGQLKEALERAWDRRGEWERLGVSARKRVEQFLPVEPVTEFCNRLLRCIAETKAKS